MPQDSVTDSTHHPLAGLPYAERIRIVPTTAPLAWLRAGWDDMRAAPVVSVAYGSIFVAIGFVLTVGLSALDMLYLMTPLIAGFLLIAPLLAVGLYHMSRRLEHGQRPGFWAAVFAWRANSFHILTAGLVLMLFLMIWVRIAALIFALVFPYTNMAWSALLTSLASTDGIVFLTLGTAIGGGFAVVAFIGAAVSLPLMLDRGTDVFTAVLVSALAVFANLKAMALWAVIIVVVTALGLLTGLIGVAVTLPLIGHATWHAYRALVAWEE
ncbi:MAG: membrane protein [Rhodospirillaceae bacterium BRH_c57]|nr:MAG: membrane protein [Rhodospirillaceae bacterium BRH_c57]